MAYPETTYRQIKWTAFCGFRNGTQRGAVGQRHGNQRKKKENEIPQTKGAAKKEEKKKTSHGEGKRKKTVQVAARAEKSSCLKGKQKSRQTTAWSRKVPSRNSAKNKLGVWVGSNHPFGEKACLYPRG